VVSLKASWWAALRMSLRSSGQSKKDEASGKRCV
jgi:hypothetical protein